MECRLRVREELGMRLQWKLEEREGEILLVHCWPPVELTSDGFSHASAALSLSLSLSLSMSSSCLSIQIDAVGT